MESKYIKELVKIAADLDAEGHFEFAYEIDQLLLKEAAEKKKKKPDPKAKVRNRGAVVFPASSSKDKKDHFPINSKSQAQNALARASQYSKAPSWYGGSLESLVKAVRRAVKAKYPSIKATPASA